MYLGSKIIEYSLVRMHDRTLEFVIVVLLEATLALVIQAGDTITESTLAVGYVLNKLTVPLLFGFDSLTQNKRRKICKHLRIVKSPLVQLETRDAWKYNVRCFTAMREGMVYIILNLFLPSLLKLKKYVQSGMPIHICWRT